ncbi:hypothetical protein IU459_34875 [Nocardia amamiensis]|uniref:Uncharacterized protein n=1 Tax=Nocardia amamiensis TaxID=404578 RepID=A0ABS0D1F9_9NOCA|nr:hypothetical protein [Nocardia amamiensis]MBF6302680.1 hypothetical protein [Nocardia amamiensis]
MDPSVVVAAVAAAVSTGALTGLTEGAKLAIADAYAQLKAVIARKYAGVDVSVVESRPDSVMRQNVLEAELVEASTGEDDELQRAAEHLLRVVHEHAPRAPELVGVRLVRISAGGLEVSRVKSRGATAVDARDLDVEGRVVIRDIEVEREGHAPDPR